MRSRTLPVLVVFGAVSVLLLWIARGGDHYGTNLAMNLGAEFIGTLVVIFALTPITRRAERGRVREHRHLNSRRNLQTLYAFQRDLDDDLRHRFEVRLYSTSASVQVYCWDNRLLASFLPLGRLSGDHAQLEVLPGDHTETAQAQARYREKYDRTETVFVRLRPATPRPPGVQAGGRAGGVAVGHSAIGGRMHEWVTAAGGARRG